MALRDSAYLTCWVASVRGISTFPVHVYSISPSCVYMRPAMHSLAFNKAEGGVC